MNLRSYLFLFVFAFVSIMFLSCKTEDTEECACRAIKEAYYRTSPDDEGIIVRVSNVIPNSNFDEGDGIADVVTDGAEVVGYYDNDCNKIFTEPESGVFCIEFSDGRMIKVLK